jgi:CRP/FNR family transcriptional regulator, cyclic AMP receptor protein
MTTPHNTAQSPLDRPSHGNKGRTNSAELEKDIVAIPFLEGLSARHIAVLAACVHRTHFKEGQIVFRQGETANRFYLIEDGMVELEDATNWGGRRIVAGGIGPGGVLGWSWLFPPYEWQFTARALTDTTAIFFYATLLRERCEADPSLGFELLKRLAPEMVNRLQSARRRLLDCADGLSPIGAEHAIGEWNVV